MKFFGCRKFAGILLLFALTCGGCQPFSSEQSQKKTAVSIQQLNDPTCTIAVSEAGPAYEAVKRDLPKAKRLYLMGQPAYDAVRSGKADAYADGRTPIDVAVANGLSGVKILPDKIGDPIDIAVGISKNSKYPGLKDKINTFIAELKANGTLQDMYQRWAVDRNFTMPDIPVPEKADTKLVVGTTGLVMPFTYYEGTTLTGYDIELSRRFAQWLGAELEFKVYNFGGILPAAVAGEVDCLMSNLFVTPERKEKMDFSDPIYIESVALMVKDDDAVSVSEASEEKGYYSLSDLDGKRIGVFTGAIHDKMVKKVLPKAECVYFDSIANALSAVTSGKIEAVAIDEQIVKAVEQENSSVRHIDEYLEAFDNAFIAAKTPEGDKIRTQLNEFIRSIKSDGTLQQIQEIWEGTDESKKTLPDYKNYPDTNGTISIAAENETHPFSYIKDRRHVGYEIDILARFCKAYGYRPDIDGVSFPAILPAVKSGKYMLGAASFTITEERKENVNFTEPTYTGGAMLLVKKTPEELKASESNTPSAVQSPAKYTKLADLRGKKIGIQTGVDSWARLVKKLIPDAEVLFFNDITGLATALESGKIDAFLESNVAMAMLTAVKKNITVLDENISEGYSCAVALRRDEKGQKLKAQWDEYITALKKDGKIDALMDKWTGSDESVKTIPDYESLPAPNGELVMPTDGVYPPLSYYSGNTLKGFELDVAARFCEAYGYGLKIKLMSFPGMLPSIATGKCDFSVAAASVTEEHKETLTLSVPLYTYTTKIAVLASQEDTPAPAVKTPDEKHTALAGLNGKRIGVPTGVDEWTVIISKLLPDAEPVYYNTTADLIAALESGKIEAFPCDAPMLDLIMSQNKNIAALDETFPESYEAGVAFPKTEKGRRLKAQWDEYITFLKNTGKLEDLVRKWTGADESAKTVPDYESFPAPNGVLITATNGDYPPFNYYSNNKLQGLEIDLAAGFCQAYGYGLKYRVMTYDGILPSVKSGKSDFVLAALSLTEEHAENLLFSIPYYTFTTKIAVLASKKETPAPAQDNHSEKDPRLAALNGKRIGVITGVDEWTYILHRLFPDSELVYYNEWADLSIAMLGGKIAAFVCDTPVLDLLMQENKNIASMGVFIGESFDVAAAFPKTDKAQKLKAQFDEFITALKNTGELDSIINKWTNAENPDKNIPDYKALPAPNGVLEMAADGTNPPFAYYIGHDMAGFEIELAAKFCEAYGYGLKIDVMSYEAILPALRSGKCDFSLADLVPTKEHAENVLFSVPYYVSTTSVAVPADSPLAAKAPAQKKLETLQSSSARFSTIHDLAGKRIAVATGTTHPQIAAKFVPTAELVYFDGIVDSLTALKAGKADAACTGTIFLRNMTAEDDSLAPLGEQLTFIDCAPIFPKTEKGRKLCEQFSEFAKACWDDGTIHKLESLWFDSEESKRVMKDYSSLPSSNGVLRMAVDVSMPPCVYMKDNRIVGYDVDFAVRFCEAYGYGLKIMPMNFAAIIPALNAGKCDFGIGTITITDERKENMLFSYPNLKAGNVFAVRKENTLPQTPKKSGTEFADINKLAGKKVAVQTGGISEQIVKRFVPEAQIAYFDNNTDLVTALKTKKVEALCTDIPVAKFMMSQYDNMTMLGDPLTEDNLAAIFAKTEKGRKLCGQFSEFTKAAWENGTIQELESIWFGKDDSRRVVKDYSKLSAPNGKLRMAVDPSTVPFAYMKGSRIIGYDVDFAVRFCEKHGYGLEIMPINFAGLIPAVMSGKCDFALSCITVTEERAESVLFSEPNAKSGIGIFVRKSDTQTQQTQTARTSGQYNTLEEIAAKRIGVQTGTASALLVEEKLPNAKILYFDSLADTLVALKAGKVDALVSTIFLASHMVNTNNDITILNQWLRTTDISPIFTKSDRGRKLCEEYSEFLKGLWNDGTIDKLNDIWLGPDESRKIIKDYSNLPATNGTIRLAVDSSMPPLAYVRDNRVVGYDIDLAVRFCEAKGYGLKITQGSVPAILAEVMSGKSDFTMSLMYTEERAENALFPKTPSGHSGNVVVVMKAKPVQTSGRYNSIQELSGKKIGVMTGTTNERLVAENIPTAAREYFNTLPDALLALKTGKIDAICCSVYAARYMMIENDDITYLENMLANLELVPIFSPTDKGRKLRDEYSEFLKGLWDDGTINEIDSIWLGKDESKRVIKDYSKLPAPNGILRMAAEPTDIPFVYMKDNQFVGYDVDIAVRFCEKYGYGLEVVPMNFPAVISSVNSGKTDFSASMHWNQERAQSALFASVPTAHSGNVIVVMKAKPESYEGEYSSFEELAGKNIGAQTGTPNGDFALKAIPTANIQYFDGFADIITALKMRKIDAAALALNAARFMLIYNEDLTAMGKPLAELDAAPIFAKTNKGRKLCEQFNKFIKAQWDNGTLQELDSIWFGRDESKRTPKDYASLPAPNGVLKMAVDTSLAPFAYVKENQIVGYEIDCAVKFCQEYGYGLEVVPMNFGAIIAAVQSGKCDFASCTIAITPERAEQVLFASPNAKTGSVLVVRKAKTQPVTVQPKTETPSPAIPVQAAPNQPSMFAEKFSAFMEDAKVFFEELKASFNRTFLREERWRLFIEGIINTMIITVLSILFGTVLGFVVYLFCRGGNVFANLLTRFFIWLIEGTPIVVLLMILYYIIFGKVDIPGIWVAVIAFTLTFGAGFYGMLRSGTGALDRGQTEAAYALGFSDTQTFFTVILPQAALHFMPAYKSSVVALIKSTAIVGYIAVQDLTKMGDIVRSRTYEAFFPLIAVAAIYFVLAGILNIIVGMIHNRIRPEKRTKDDILKGVDSHD